MNRPRLAETIGDLETQSRTTYENAVESKRLLEQRGIGKVVLVTEAIHLPRGVGCFRRQGFEVVPAACQYRATRFELAPSRFLPNANAALNFQEVWHEWLGLAWYWLRGRI